VSDSVNRNGRKPHKTGNFPMKMTFSASDSNGILYRAGVLVTRRLCWC
jgi:hypothetical protein